MARQASGLILLVEDNPDDEALTVDALRTAGITAEIQVARDGAQAIEYLSQSDRRVPDIVLLDLKLPRVPGLEVLRRLRESNRTRTIPVVVFTSSIETSDIARAYAGGANSYVRKPVDFDQFAEAARMLGLYWLTVNEPATGGAPSI